MRVTRNLGGDMAFLSPGARALDYFPCRYGDSRLVFRGPPRRLDRPYVAALGGTETYGKYIAEPWPDALERRCGRPVVNLGYPNAGVETWLSDRSLVAIAAAAQEVIVQATGVHNVNNPFYAVHGRRPDRFLRARPALRALYPEVDFTEFAFTRHLLGALHARCPDRFGRVVAAVRQAWLCRMDDLLTALAQPPTLLWIARDKPPPATAPPRPDAEPPLLHAGMIDALRPRLAAVVTVVAAPAAPADRGGEAVAAAALGLPDMLPPEEMAAALGLPGSEAHAAAAGALAERMGRRAG
jgi:hypothetical protein